MGFNFERNLPHQEEAVEAVIDVFNDVLIRKRTNSMSNHLFETTEDNVLKNIEEIQKRNRIKGNVPQLNPYFNLDIKMETGTGKTYTYTKTIFELNRQYDINKFIIVVPTLPIKAGTEQFLRSEGTRLHFKEDYGKAIELHVLNSQKAKNKREYFPLEISNFVRATFYDKKIHVLLVNTGMLNSTTMNKVFDDSSLFGSAETPFQLLARTKPIIIIDEPHKYKRSGRSYENLLKLKPQCMIRYGATFPEKVKSKKDYENLLYDLDAVKAFNNDLVKGVVVHIPKFEGRKNAKLSLINTDGKIASFKYVDENNERTYKMEKGDSLAAVSADLKGITIERLNKSIVELSNGIILEKNQAIHPTSFSETYQEVLMRQAIDLHFEKEREYFGLPVRIKPLTLFFIDDVQAYREEEDRTPYVKNIFENLLKGKIESILKEDISEEYKDYLLASLIALTDTHGGYFSKDNSDKDDKIQKEIEEILRDKEKLLSYKIDEQWNVRRFIFSKWTLKEGWDNPNVFTICKLRSSGSEISKLQEVGRGLRLPVNENLFRVKNTQFDLNYIVDFTESKFADELVKEINESTPPEQLQSVSDTQLALLAKTYNKSEDDIFDELYGKRIIDRKANILEGKREELYLLYPELNQSLKREKVRKSTSSKQYVTVRQSNYEDFKPLWETINQKVYVNYKLGSEETIRNLLVEILEKEQVEEFDSVKFIAKNIEKNASGSAVTVSNEQDNKYYLQQYHEELPYNQFLKVISKGTSVPLQTIHGALVKYNENHEFKKGTFFTRRTALNIASKYRDRIALLMLQKIEYSKIDVSVHPTALTNIDGTLKRIVAHTVGTKYSEAKPQEKYLYEELFYDSNENETINEIISEVTVFGKIPKNSIRIPVINGQTYSPDFAYVVKQKDGKTKLNIVIESKNKEERFLAKDEQDKIALANRFFDAINDSDVKVVFETQLQGKRITNIISNILSKQAN
ncbi:type III restriction-modification system endonuclease [Priestia megaterium]|uniref:type III restriction-modification system endonuclease n=1 Tax=Priestia megaterium TaxID=1404 RepID=UPI002864D924|nr:type III restriction-modification system endonuclease [Priestia megaterium]MDR7207960.1 type III restriction enzyme [Priestia megaterium]